eukprot:444758_1
MDITRDIEFKTLHLPSGFSTSFGHTLFCGWIVFNGSTQTTCTMNTALGCTNTLLCQRFHLNHFHLFTCVPYIIKRCTYALSTVLVHQILYVVVSAVGSRLHTLLPNL